METFKNEDLLEPIELYEKRLKEAFHNNAIKYFEELEKNGKVDVARNQAACKKYYSESEQYKQIKGKRSGRIALEVLGYVFGGIALIVGIVLLIVSKNTAVKYGAGFGLIAGGIALIVGGILLIKGIKQLKAIMDKHEAEANKALKEAWETMKPINDQYEFNMAAGLMSKTTPLLQLDPVFDGKKFQLLHEKYDFNENDYTDTSAVAVQSGSILGNPFVFEKNYCQTMQDHVYTGSMTVTYTRRVYDGKNYRNETVTEVLTAQVVKPEPAYYYDTVLIYGNDAAPNLSFSRKPTNINSMNEKQIQNYVKDFDKKLDKKVQKDLKNGEGTFTRLHNDEFEALFNALNRDNETEFRLLFTPLGQQNMIKLLKGKNIGFGDDFYFKKAKKLNIIRSQHMQSSNSLDRDPETLKTFDYSKAKDMFVNYCDKYLKDVFFDLAPLISIPVYQQHKTIDYIYKDEFKHNVTQLEAEAAANSHDINLFKHPATRSLGVILKSYFNKKEGDADLVNIVAHSFEGIDQITYVPRVAGNGHTYNVPVHWVEYRPISKNTPFVVSDTGADLKGYKALYETGKFNEMINKFSGSSDILYKKRLFSFLPKDNK